jgi:pilus assembly protein FimV
MQVKSGLNQPLLAEIPIVSAAPAELNELDVHLASPDAFAAVGLDRPYGLSANLQFSIGKNAGGQPVVRITTAGRFNEPVLSFLMEAKWATGTVTREYTALIDPPYIAPAVVKPMSAPAITEAAAPEPAQASVPEASAPTPQPIPAQMEPASEPAPAMASPLPTPVVQQPAPPAPAPVAAAPAPKPSHQTPAAPTPKPVAAPPKPVVAAPKPAPAPAPSGDSVPVADGKTLWSIANQVRPDASVSVNQVMLALLRVNPEAFTDSNINRLKSGAVLRIPNRDEIATLTPDDAAALVREQAAAWKTPLQATPQPAQGVAESVAPAPVASAPARAPSARLEIVPPSGKASARGTQSGATAGGGGSELRAELLQTNEELAARTAEVTELKSRVSDLEKQEADRQHLIDLQNSQLKDLQTRLQEKEAAPAAAAPAPATSPEVAPADDVVKETPIYFNPWVLGGGGLILVGGLVFAMRRKPAVVRAEDTTSRRISDDEALRASLAKTRAAIIRPGATPAAPAPAPEPVVAPVSAESIGDSELDALVRAVQQNPRDTEAHLNLLRLYHARGNAVEYEEAAQAMRGQIATTLDPRWREAVIMGASLLPGHALFNQAGWNTPRFGVPDPVASPVTDSMPEVAPAPPEPAIKAAEPISASGVFDLPEHEDSEPAMSVEASHPEDSHPEASHPEDSHVDEMHEFGEGELDLIDAPGDLANAIPGHNDIHRSESQVQEEDEASATRIELAKAYLDIGDLDGARSMLEEVLAEGGPAAQAEAERILREIG